MLFVSRNRNAVESCTSSPLRQVIASLDAPTPRNADSLANHRTPNATIYLIEGHPNDKGATVHRSKQMLHFGI